MRRVHLASYCIPGAALCRSGSPYPVGHLSICPAAPELVVANGQGGLMLWSFEKHRSVRVFDSDAAVL